MPAYHPCPHCGANLDPGEGCDCRVQQKITRRAAKVTNTLCPPAPTIPTYIPDSFTQTNKRR